MVGARGGRQCKFAGLIGSNQLRTRLPAHVRFWNGPSLRIDHLAANRADLLGGSMVGPLWLATDQPYPEPADNQPSQRNVFIPIELIPLHELAGGDFAEAFVDWNSVWPLHSTEILADCFWRLAAGQTHLAKRRRSLPNCLWEAG